MAFTRRTAYARARRARPVETADARAGARGPCRAPQMFLCENHLHSAAEVEETLVHELVHAFDYCRAHVDFHNGLHLACTEVRAANLSGECRLWKEMMRGYLGFVGHHRECVRRRAIKSVRAACPPPNCRPDEAVETVFESCFADTQPYGHIP